MQTTGKCVKSKMNISNSDTTYSDCTDSDSEYEVDFEPAKPAVINEKIIGNNLNEKSLPNSMGKEKKTNYIENIDNTEIYKLDDVIVNLGIFADIKKNDKLILNDKRKFSIDRRIFKGLRRKWDSQSIEHHIDTIQKTIDDASNHYEKLKLNREEHFDMNRLLTSLTKATTGLENLKETYKNEGKTEIYVKLDMYIGVMSKICRDR